jgi:hypothetical protein
MSGDEVGILTTIKTKESTLESHHNLTVNTLKGAKDCVTTI